MTNAASDPVYAGAVDHYLSPQRKDAVKQYWEEPATRALLARSASALELSRPPRVLDMGCGAGDGLSLLLSLSEAQRWRASPDPMRYVGLDLNTCLRA